MKQIGINVQVTNRHHYELSSINLENRCSDFNWRTTRSENSPSECDYKLDLFKSLFSNQYIFIKFQTQSNNTLHK